jgi:hypothetical protein
MRLILAALILTMIAGPDAYGGEGRYRCEVESFYGFEDAEFRRDDGSDLIGDRFAVDRSTGTISGFELNNEMAQQRLVLDRGSEKQAFKVLSIYQVYGPYHNVKYLYIEEFEPKAEKAFFAVSGSGLLTGHCTR